MHMWSLVHNTSFRNSRVSEMCVVSFDPNDEDIVFLFCDYLSGDARYTRLLNASGSMSLNCKVGLISFRSSCLCILRGQQRFLHFYLPKFHRSTCLLPSNGELAPKDFLVLCGRCMNLHAFFPFISTRGRCWLAHTFSRKNFGAKFFHSTPKQLGP